MVEPLVVSPSGVDAIALGDNAAFEHDGVLVQHDGISAGEVGRSLAFVRDPRFVGTGFFAGEAPDGLTTVYGDPIPADVFVYWRDPDDPMAQEILVGATKSASDGTWCITGLNYNLQYVIRARASGRDDVTVVGVQPSRSDVIAYVDQLVPHEDEFGDVDGLTGYVLLDSGLPPFTCQVIEPLPYGLSARIEGRKLLIEGESTDNGLWSSVVRVTASNGVWVDVPVQVEIQAPFDPHWDKVVALLHFDGDLTDETGRVWSPTNIGWVDSLAGFGKALDTSLTLTSRITTPNSSDFNFRGDDFTIEVLFTPYALTVANQWRGIISKRSSSSDQSFSLYQNTQNSGIASAFRFSDGSSENLSYSHPLEIGSTYRVAISRAGSELRMFVNGILSDSATIGSKMIATTSHGLSVGRLDGSGTTASRFSGYIDELRITKGVARYTADFTPPDKPFPNQ